MPRFVDAAEDGVESAHIGNEVFDALGMSGEGVFFLHHGLEVVAGALADLVQELVPRSTIFWAVARFERSATGVI